MLRAVGKLDNYSFVAIYADDDAVNLLIPGGMTLVVYLGEPHKDTFPRHFLRLVLKIDTILG